MLSGDRDYNTVAAPWSRGSRDGSTWVKCLLKTDEGWTASRVAAAFDVSERTVRQAKRRYVEEGLEEVLRHHNSPTPHCKVDEKGKPT